jgi:hypothetical protein
VRLSGVCKSKERRDAAGKGHLKYAMAGPLAALSWLLLPPCTYIAALTMYMQQLLLGDGPILMQTPPGAGRVHQRNYFHSPPTLCAVCMNYRTPPPLWEPALFPVWCCEFASHVRAFRHCDIRSRLTFAVNYWELFFIDCSLYERLMIWGRAKTLTLWLLLPFAIELRPPLIENDQQASPSSDSPPSSCAQPIPRQSR